jgi:hypothetical protein
MPEFYTGLATCDMDELESNQFYDSSEFVPDANKYKTEVHLWASGSLNAGNTSQETYKAVTDHALEVLKNERTLFHELVDELKLFKTSPSYSVTPISANPDEKSLTSSLRRLTDIVCKDNGRSEPTTQELRQASNTF